MIESKTSVKDGLITVELAEQCMVAYNKQFAENLIASFNFAGSELISSNTAAFAVKQELERLSWRSHSLDATT